MVPGNDDPGSRTPRKWLLKVAATVCFFYFIYSQVSLADVLARVRLADQALLGCACLGSVATRLMAALRLGGLSGAQGLPLRFTEAASVEFSSLFYRVFLPGGTLASLAVRFWKLQARTGDRARALACVGIDRWFATIGLLVVGLLFTLLRGTRGTVLADSAPVPEFVPSRYAAILFACLLIPLLGVFAAVTRGGLRSLTEALARILRNPRLTSKVENWLTPLEAFRRLTPAQTWSAFLLSLAVHALGIVTLVWIARSLGVAVDWADLGWIRSLVMLATMLPISFLGLGVRDFALVALLGHFGVTEESSLALATLLFVVTVVLPALIGGIVEWVGTASRKLEEADSKEVS